MHLPPQFEETRPEVLHALMRGRPLATLVTSGDSGIAADHLPLQAVPSPLPLGSLRGHIARANPLWRQGTECEALAIFHGPQAYISPSAYPSKKESGKVVPTWDYAVVHARGTLRFIHDAEWLRNFLSSLTDAQEADRPAPWTLDDAPAGYVDSMLKAIVGFELTLSQLTGKWKVSQNRSAADQRGVIDVLSSADDSDAREIAAMLAERGGLP